MKHEIKTSAGLLTIEPTPFYGNQVQITVKPAIFPGIVISLTAEDADKIGEALFQTASEVQALKARSGQPL